jgi:hypothetical protein
VTKNSQLSTGAGTKDAQTRQCSWGCEQDLLDGISASLPIYLKSTLSTGPRRAREGSPPAQGLEKTSKKVVIESRRQKIFTMDFSSSCSFPQC